jgi:hypothetical protein
LSDAGWGRATPTTGRLWAFEGDIATPEAAAEENAVRALDEVGESDAKAFAHRGVQAGVSKLDALRT